LTFKDLLSLTHSKSAKSLLEPKGFIFSDEYKGIEMGYKNKGKADEEKIMFHNAKMTPIYTTYDTTYMHTIINEVKKAIP
jgi:hypothetical protein